QFRLRVAVADEQHGLSRRIGRKRSDLVQKRLRDLRIVVHGPAIREPCADPHRLKIRSAFRLVASAQSPADFPDMHAAGRYEKRNGEKVGHPERFQPVDAILDEPAFHQLQIRRFHGNFGARPLPQQKSGLPHSRFDAFHPDRFPRSVADDENARTQAPRASFPPPTGVCHIKMLANGRRKVNKAAGLPTAVAIIATGRDSLIASASAKPPASDAPRSSGTSWTMPLPLARSCPVKIATDISSATGGRLRFHEYITDIGSVSMRFGSGKPYPRRVEPALADGMSVACSVRRNTGSSTR